MDSQQLLERIIKIEATQNFYSSNLSMQTGFYSIVVIILVTLYFIFQYKISKNEIKKYVNVAAKKIKEELEVNYKKESSSIKKEFEEEFKKMNAGLLTGKRDIYSLNGQSSRTLAIVSSDRGLHIISFKWWLLAIKNFIKAGDDKLIKISLNAANSKLLEMKNKKIKIDMDAIKNHLNTLPEIDDTKYKKEKDDLIRNMDELIKS